jgi:hypothetical protein
MTNHTSLSGGGIKKNKLCPICFHSTDSAAHKAAAHSLYEGTVNYYQKDTKSEVGK